MKNEISNILNLIETGNTIKALEEAKTFHSQHKNNLDGIKLLAYTYIHMTVIVYYYIYFNPNAGNIQGLHIYIYPYDC